MKSHEFITPKHKQLEKDSFKMSTLGNATKESKPMTANEVAAQKTQNSTKKDK